MSANTFLAALYPPTPPYVFEEGLNWQAFPTHTISRSLDYVSWEYIQFSVGKIQKWLRVLNNCFYFFLGEFFKVSCELAEFPSIFSNRTTCNAFLTEAHVMQNSDS